MGGTDGNSMSLMGTPWHLWEHHGTYGTTMSTIRKAKTGLADLARTLPVDDDTRTALADQRAENRLIQMAIRVPLELLNHLRRAAYWEPKLTLTGIIRAGAGIELARLEAERGRVYAPLPEGERVKRGRPLKLGFD